MLTNVDITNNAERAVMFSQEENEIELRNVESKNNNESCLVMESMQIIKMFASHMNSTVDGPLQNRSLALDFKDVYMKALRSSIHGNLTWSASISRGTRSTKKISINITRSSFDLLIGKPHSCK